MHIQYSPYTQLLALLEAGHPRLGANSTANVLNGNPWLRQRLVYLLKNTQNTDITLTSPLAAKVHPYSYSFLKFSGSRLCVFLATLFAGTPLKSELGVFRDARKYCTARSEYKICRVGKLGKNRVLQ